MGKSLSWYGCCFCMIVSLDGCYNASTPAGHEGYVTQGAIVGSQRFYGTQAGPTSTGLGWLLRVVNIDMQWRTTDESFDVMSADNLSLAFKAHLVMRPKPGAIKEIVETYGGEQWYARALQQPFRNAVYEAVAGYKALDAKDRRDQIAADAQKKFLVYTQGKPFEIQSVTIGTINLPKMVAEAQEQKIKAETTIEQKTFEIRVAEQEAKVRIKEAEGIAEAQKIINVTLTPMYLQHEAIKAQQQMANSPNHTTVYIPVGTNGLPLVKTTD